MRFRTFDLALPIAGFAAGLALLIAFGVPSRAADGRTPAAPATATARGAARGALLGVVLDAHGDAVPGAQVRVLDENGTTIATTQAGAGEGALSLGQFRFDELPAGVYQVAASVPGSAEARARVPIASYDDTRVRLHLDLGY